MMFNQDFKEFIESLSTNVEFDICFDAKITAKIGGVVVNFIDLENLKKNKRASGRLQDLADLEKLDTSQE